MVRVVPFESLPAKRRLGTLAGKGVVTADLKKDFAGDIEAMFYGGR